MKEKYKKIIGLIMLVLFVALFIAFIIASGRANRRNIKCTLDGFAMGTQISITTYGSDGKKLNNEILEKLDNLEKQQISWRIQGSELNDINENYEAGVPYKISDDMASYLKSAISLGDKSQGMLDITIRPLAELWGIEDGNTQVPKDYLIDGALKEVDYKAVSIKGNEITIENPDMILDLGAVGKGIACDKVGEMLSHSSITGGCVAVGGSIILYGQKPEDILWKVGIKSPRGEENQIMGSLEIDAKDHEMFVSTSGDYEKYFMEDGKRYHHILDPHTGYPADTGIISATVVCDNGALSDGLSTVCILLGKDKALKLLKEYGAQAVLIDDNLKVYVTDGLKDCFEIKDDKYDLANNQ